MFAPTFSWIGDFFVFLVFIVFMLRPLCWISLYMNMHAMNWCSWRWLWGRIGLCTHACSSAILWVSRMLHLVYTIEWTAVSWREQKCPNVLNGGYGDSNQVSLDYESGILRLSYCAPCSKVEGKTSSVMRPATMMMMTWEMNMQQIVSLLSS